MQVSDYFSANYAAAREKFRNAATGASAVQARYHNPATGPDGLELSCDTAWLGPRGAERVLIVMSGTHGAETFSGSAIQVGLLQSGIASEIARGTGLLLIHAINPSGFAWVRRVTEGNIDLNRNFIDHARPHPRNAGYEALRDAIRRIALSEMCILVRISAVVVERCFPQHGAGGHHAGADREHFLGVTTRGAASLRSHAQVAWIDEFDVLSILLEPSCRGAHRIRGTLP